MANWVLNKVASGNDHYSTSCIASHCTVVSVGTVKEWDPLPRCSSATWRRSVHTHHSSISMMPTTCMTSLARDSLVCSNQYTFRNVSPRN